MSTKELSDNDRMSLLLRENKRLCSELDKVKEEMGYYIPKSRVKGFRQAIHQLERAVENRDEKIAFYRKEVTLLHEKIRNIRKGVDNG